MTCPVQSVGGAARAARPAPSAGLPEQRIGSPAAPSSTPSPSDPPASRVLLIDPESTSAQRLARALTDSGIATVSTAPNMESATGIDQGAPPAAGTPAQNLAIVSLRLGPDAASAISRLRATGWQRVLALSTTAAIGEITEALAAGATGAVVTGRSAPARNVPAGVYDLSPREVEVVRMVADGRSNKWIGEDLGLSALTVKSHLARIGRKLGTGDRAHMVTLALRAGIIS